MKIDKKRIYFHKGNFLLFKIFLWVCTCLLFVSFSILIPTILSNLIEEFFVFFILMLTVNIHTSYLHKVVSKKSIFLYITLLTGSIIICVLFEMLLFSKSIEEVYAFMDRKLSCFIIGSYITIRDFALFVFFFWVEHFNKLIHLSREKEKIHKEEMELLIEKHEFEKKFSRKKLLPHYFFNILEHMNIESLATKKNTELMDKVKFVLYYFLVDAEKEKIELDKELAFYKYYIELEKVRYMKDISVKFNVFGVPENFTIIPLLFEPLIGNAMKYTNHDGTGWVDITVDALHFPLLKFYCKNNYSRCISKIISSENGLKIFEQRLDLCYKKKHTLTIKQEDNIFEALLSIEVV